jgi:hypothetical protein
MCNLDYYNRKSQFTTSGRCLVAFLLGGKYARFLNCIFDVVLSIVGPGWSVGERVGQSVALLVSSADGSELRGGHRSPPIDR